MDNNGQHEKEYIATTASYGGASILCTNLGRYIVVMAGAHYPVASLDAAKALIDEANKTKQN